MRAEESKGVERPGPDAIGAIVKRYRKRDQQYTYGLRIRAYGERYWVPLGTEREGWNDVRAADRRDEIAALIRRGVWRPPNAFELDPREQDPGLHEFASDWLARYRRTVRPRTAESAEYLLRRHLLPYLHPYRLERDRLRAAVELRRQEARAERGGLRRARRGDHPTRPARARAARARPADDQHDAGTARGDSERRGQTWADPGQPRRRPPTSG